MEHEPWRELAPAQVGGEAAHAAPVSKAAVRFVARHACRLMGWLDRKGGLAAGHNGGQSAAVAAASCFNESSWVRPCQAGCCSRCVKLQQKQLCAALPGGLLQVHSQPAPPTSMSYPASNRTYLLR